MNDFTTELLQTLATKGSLNELFRSHLEMAVNALLQTELTAFLDDEKYDQTGFHTGNSRNGSYDRTVKIEYDKLHLQILRDRNGEVQTTDGRMTRQKRPSSTSFGKATRCLKFPT